MSGRIHPTPDKGFGIHDSFAVPTTTPKTPLTVVATTKGVLQVATAREGFDISFEIPEPYLGGVAADGTYLGRV